MWESGEGMMPQREDWVSESHDAVLLESARASKGLVPGQCHLPLKESSLVTVFTCHGKKPPLYDETVRE